MVELSARRVLIPAGIGTWLSLLGDASLYTVLPTHTKVAGVTLAGVGILLSANRLIRLFLNSPAGKAYSKRRRRPLFVGALFIGAISTSMYGLTSGFVPLLIGRLLWGLAWAGIWVGGNTIVMDISTEKTRGKLVGFYQLAFFLGSATGSLLGGVLTDLVGFQQTMLINAGLSTIGAFAALFYLPETKPNNIEEESLDNATVGKPVLWNKKNKGDFGGAITIYSANRLIIAGIFLSTFGLYLQNQFGDTITIGNKVFGVTSMTGIGLSLTTIIAMAASPIIGGISDNIRNRWVTASAGLLPGIAGFGLLANGAPWAILSSVPLMAITSGSNQSLATAITGDIGNGGQRSQHLGWLFTGGDLTSAIGPPLAYAVIPILGLNRLYFLCGLIFLGVMLLSLRLGKNEQNI